MEGYLHGAVLFLAACFVIYLWWALRSKALPLMEAWETQIASMQLRQIVAIAVTWAATKCESLTGPEKMTWVIKELNGLGIKVEPKYVEFVYQQIKDKLPGAKPGAVSETPPQ